MWGNVMKKYLKDYISDFEKELNIPLMNKEADRPLVEYIIDSWKSLEIVKNIRILKWSYSDDESKIDINDFILKRDKKKKKKDRVKYKFINDDRFGSLTVWVEITMWSQPKKDGTQELQKKIIKKNMLIPVQDENGFFHIKGNKYYLLYQMVDKSTYTSKQANILKSLMPNIMKRYTVEEKDINGKVYKLPLYKIVVFKKEIEVLAFYAVNGLSYALSYFCVQSIIDVTTTTDNPDMFIYFPISSKVFLAVYKDLFDKYQYVQGIVAMILSMTTNRFTLDDVNNPEYWIKKIGSGNIDKGKDLLIFVTRLLDETTKKILKLSEYHKVDIYPLLRWMLMEYNEIRSKDNLSLDNKRLRCNEYIASLLTIEFSKRLNRVISLGNKATIEDFKDIFKFSGEIILQKMHSSGILRYDENINDMDFFSKFKYTKTIVGVVKPL